MVNQIIQKGSVKDRRRIEFLPGDGCPNDGKNSGANHGSDTKSSKRDRTESLLELTIRLFAVRDQFVDGLPGKKLVAQRSAPSSRNEIHRKKPGKPTTAMQSPPRHVARGGAVLALGRAASQLFRLRLLRPTRIIARLQRFLGLSFFARRALCLLACIFFQLLRICHNPLVMRIYPRRLESAEV
jgi:hypothetical protein